MGLVLVGVLVLVDVLVPVGTLSQTMREIVRVLRFRGRIRWYSYQQPTNKDEKVARPIVSKYLVDQSAQPESDGSMQRFSSNLWCAALTVSAEIIETRLIGAAPTHRKNPNLNLD